MTPLPQVSIPIGRRFRLWRARTLVILFWIGCGAFAYSIMLNRQARIDAVGVVFSNEWHVAGIEEGRVSSIAVDFFDSVEAGQIVVILDSTVHDAELEVVRTELLLARASLDAEAQKLLLDAGRDRLDLIDEKRRLLVDYEQARLDMLDRIAAIEVSRVTVQRLGADIERLKMLAGYKLTRAAELESLEYQRKEVLKSIEENEKAVEISRAQAESTRDRLAWSDETIVDASSNALLSPFRADIDFQEKRLQQMVAMRADFILRAPVSGTVTQIYRRPGEAILSGEPIVVITDPLSTRVFAYVDEKVAWRIQPGAAAQIRLADEGGPIIDTRVARIGPGVSDLPISLWSDLNMPVRGVPAVLDIPPNPRLMPGKRVSVSIIPG